MKFKCKNCGVEIEEYKVKTFDKKFCSIKCRTRYNSLVRYNKLKNNPKFKQEQKERFKKWVAKNKEKLNEYQRISMNKKLKENPIYTQKQKEYRHKPEVMKKDNERSRKYYWEHKK